MSKWEEISNYSRIEQLAFFLIMLTDSSEPVERSVRHPDMKYSPNDVLAALRADDADEGDLDAILVELTLLDESSYRMLLLEAADRLLIKFKSRIPPESKQ